MIVRTVILGVCFCLMAVLPTFADLAKIESFLENEHLWETTPASFITNPRDGSFFRWLSSKKDAARYPGYGNSPEMTFLGRKCWEAVVRFEEGRLSDVTISLYNRGDAGDIGDEKKFQTMLEGICADIEKWVGEKGVVQPTMKLANGMKLEKKAWVRDNRLAVEMRWSASEHIKVEDRENPGAMNRVRFRAEYVQLVVTKYDSKNDPRKPSALSAVKPATSATSKDIKANVKKDADGSVYIENIPMVDQGQKGYCAAATAQRILEYYGNDVDQHIVAQIANTSSSEGTSFDRMIDVLTKLGVKFGVRVKMHMEFTVQKFVTLVNEYNNTARRQKKKLITLGQTIDMTDIYREMDPEILKEARCHRDKAGRREFMSNITRHVDGGIPLAWSVTLGIVPEKPELPQTFGGHMRIILGYNKDKNEIIYSDSWGAGHERKTMSTDDAWTITTGLYSFDPRK